MYEKFIVSFTKVTMSSNRNPVGRPAGDIYYDTVAYNGREYIVGTCFSNGEPVEFVFDKDDEDKVIGRSWHRSAEKYIGSAHIEAGKRKQLFLHNLIANRLGWHGKGQTETVDHINRIGFDNRKENLRIITQSEQNFNQTKRSRSIILPDGCGIEVSEIPRHIWYIKANGAHGDRFAIEFKTENIVWKTTSSVKVSLRDKLAQAKEKLAEFYVQYPHLNPFNPEKLAKEEELIQSFQAIIDLSKQ
jgi:hypothetical protein